MIAHFGVGADFARQRGNVPRLRPRRRVLATAGEPHAAASRAFHVRPACRRPLRPLFADRAANPAARHTLPRPGECAVGTVAARGESSPRPRSERLRALARRARRRRHRRSDVHVQVARQGVGEPDRRALRWFFCVAFVVVALLHSTIGDVVILVPTGATWVWMLATLNTSLQLFLPAWVRARGLSIYQMVLFGAQGLGAVVWGVIADAYGLTVAFIAAAAVLAVGTASLRRWPLFDTANMDRSVVVRPDPDFEITPTSTRDASSW